jgi:hypothetical protein
LADAPACQVGGRKADSEGSVPELNVENMGETDVGIAPDIVVEPTVEDIQAGRDPALARALELLRAQLSED